MREKPTRPGDSPLLRHVRKGAEAAAALATAAFVGALLVLARLRLAEQASLDLVAEVLKTWVDGLSLAAAILILASLAGLLAAERAERRRRQEDPYSGQPPPLR